MKKANILYQENVGCKMGWYLTEHFCVSGHLHIKEQVSRHFAIIVVNILFLPL